MKTTQNILLALIYLGLALAVSGIFLWLIANAGVMKLQETLMYNLSILCYNLFT